MKCIALVMSLVVMALAEPEPFWGLGVGYPGAGLPIAIHRESAAPGQWYRVPYDYGRSHIISSPIAQPASVAAVPGPVPVNVIKVSPFQPASLAAVPDPVPVDVIEVSPVQPASVAAVPYSVPVDVPEVSPYVSTASVKAVPAALSTHQFHRQDELGNYEYGYDNVNSAKYEVGNADVGVKGTYIVKEPPRTVHYVADALGFRLVPAHLRKKRQAAIVPPTPLATRPAALMRIALNPGHATFYRVY